MNDQIDSRSPSGSSDDPVSITVEDSIPAALVIRLFVVSTLLVVFLLVSILGFFVYSESKARNELIYQNCVDGEARDTVIVQQLNGALERVRLSLPPENPVRIAQEELLQEGIRTLEPDDERECFTPDTWWPW